MSNSVERNLVGELLDEVRLLRPRADHRQFAAQDVEDLRQLIQMGPPEQVAERGDAQVLLLGPAGRLRRGALTHGAELQDLEGGSVTPGAGLAIEQRTAVAEKITEHHDRRQHDEDDKSDGGEQEIEDPLQPRIPRTVHFADVEEQRDPLELADRQLPQPLLVEQRERPDSDPVPVHQRGLDDDVLVGLRGTTQDHCCRAARTGQVDKRPSGRHARRSRLAGREGAKDHGRVFRARIQLALDGRDFFGLCDEDEPIALAGPRPRVPSDCATERVPRHEHDRSPDDDEPGEQRVPANIWTSDIEPAAHVVAAIAALTVDR